MEFFSDPAEFLAVAGERLAADPVVSTVVTTVADRELRRRASGDDTAYPHAPHWYAVARDEAGEVTGIAMRTATGAPYPLFFLEMGADDARELARHCYGRGEIAPANGVLPAAREYCDELSRLAGGRVQVKEHTRLFELTELVPPDSLPEGSLRLARRDEAELCLDWFNRFRTDAAEQAGHPGTHSMAQEFDLDDMLRRIEEKRVWVWEDPSYGVVHLTGANPPAFGVSRIGPVFTPKQHRGKGYASAAVAEVSRRILDSGDRACLFTDQANPTSNKIYEALGYRPVVDMANHDLL
jgi:RimJ/RimL family protein N-acetyltransferase